MIQLAVPTLENPLLPFDYLLLKGDVENLKRRFIELVKDAGYQWVGSGEDSQLFIGDEPDSDGSYGTRSFTTYAAEIKSALDQAAKDAHFLISQEMSALRHSEEARKVYLKAKFEHIDKLFVKLQDLGSEEADKVMDCLNALRDELIELHLPLLDWTFQKVLPHTNLPKASGGFGFATDIYFRELYRYAIGKGLIDGSDTTFTIFKNVLSWDGNGVATIPVKFISDYDLSGYFLFSISHLAARFTYTAIVKSEGFLNKANELVSARFITNHKNKFLNKILKGERPPDDKNELDSLLKKMTGENN